MKLLINEDDFARLEQLTSWIRQLTQQQATEYFDFDLKDENEKAYVLFKYSSYKTIADILLSMTHDLSELVEKMNKTPTIRG